MRYWEFDQKLGDMVLKMVLISSRLCNNTPFEGFDWSGMSTRSVEHGE